MEGGSILTFGPFRLAGPHGPLWRAQQKVTLPPKALAVLWTLAMQAGEVMTKEGVLSVHLREVRQALGDRVAAPQYIETVHRIGYRFIAAVAAAPVSSSKFQVSSQDPEPTKLPSLETRNQKLETLLVGRDAELARLHKLFAKAVNGERQLVFVTGEAGIGKTALVDTFVQSLASRVQSHQKVVSSQ